MGNGRELNGRWRIELIVLREGKNCNGSGNGNPKKEKRRNRSKREGAEREEGK